MGNLFHLVWGAVVSLCFVSMVFGMTVVRLYAPPTTDADALRACAVSADTRASAYCLKLAENVKH